MREPKCLSDILNALRVACHGERISIDDVLDEIGDRSFAPAILVPALVLVSPISGIPGLPTIGSLIILVFAVQAIMGAEHLWVPAILRRKSMPCRQIHKAVNWLEAPVRWIDRQTTNRVTILARRPWTYAAFATIAALAVIMPFLELLPFVTSVACLAISMLTLGVMVRDGLLVLGGYLTVGGFASLVLFLTQRIAEAT